MTPKIQKKLSALQAKMQKKYPNYQINYVYDKKGKVYALSYNENKQQFISLKNMKPVSENSEFFDVNDQPFVFNNGPVLYEVLDQNGNQTVLAYDNNSGQFFDPNTGEPVDIENYTDTEGNPIDLSQFADETPVDDGASYEENSQGQEDPYQETYDETNPNQGDQQQEDEEPQYDQNVEPEHLDGLEYATSNDNENQQLSTPEAYDQTSQLYENQPQENYQPDNQQYASQSIDFTNPTSQISNNYQQQPNYDQYPANNDYQNQATPNHGVDYNNFVPQNNYQQYFQQNINPTQPLDQNLNYSQQPTQEVISNPTDYNQVPQSTYQIANEPVAYNQSLQQNFQPPNNLSTQYPTAPISTFDNFQTQQPENNNSSLTYYSEPVNKNTTAQPSYEATTIDVNNNSNIFEPKKVEPVTLNYKTIEPSSIPTTEVMTKVDTSQISPIINTNYQPIIVQPQPEKNLTSTSNDTDEVTCPKLEAVANSSVEVQLDPIIASKPVINDAAIAEKPMQLNFKVAEETVSSKLFNKKTQEIVDEQPVSDKLFIKKTQEIVDEQLALDDLFNKKTKEVIVEEPVMQPELSITKEESEIFESKTPISSAEPIAQPQSIIVEEKPEVQAESAIAQEDQIIQPEQVIAKDEESVIKPDFHFSDAVQKTFVTKTISEEPELIPEPKIFITPEIRVQPQAIYSAAKKQEEIPVSAVVNDYATKNYATSVNLSDYNFNDKSENDFNEVFKPQQSFVQKEIPVETISAFKAAPVDLNETGIHYEPDYKESDLQDFKFSQSFESQKSVEQPKWTEAPKSVEPPRPIEQPKWTEAPKPVEPPRPIEQPKWTEAPKPVEPSRSVKPSRPVEPIVPELYDDYPEYEPQVEDYEYDPDYRSDLDDKYPRYPDNEGYHSYPISRRSYSNYDAPSQRSAPRFSEYSNYSRSLNVRPSRNYDYDDYFPRSFSRQPLSSFRPSPLKSRYLSTLDSDTSFRPSRRYPVSRSLTVLLDDNHISTIPELPSSHFRSSYPSASGRYYRPISSYSNSYSSRSLSNYGPYQMRTLRNWQPVSLTSSINTYSTSLPSSYSGYRSSSYRPIPRLRSYRNFR